MATPSHGIVDSGAVNSQQHSELPTGEPLNDKGHNGERIVEADEPVTHTNVAQVNGAQADQANSAGPRIERLNENGATQNGTHGNGPPAAAVEQKQSHTNGVQHDGSGEAKGRDLVHTKTFKERIKSFNSGPSGGFDPTPLPTASQGYTIRFTFQEAENLPVGDVNTGASDPYVLATLKGSQPRRHKEDPDLVHRTKTLRATTTPVWRDEWVVANVPPNGFTLKCRMYDEDFPDADDRLGNVTIKVPYIPDDWQGEPPPGRQYKAKKRTVSKRAYLLKGVVAIFRRDEHLSPRLTVSIEVLGKSDPPYAQMYTIGPTTYFKHFSPLIGRLTGTTVNNDDTGKGKACSSKSQKYDFQANEIQLQGPVPPKMYHRYVAFRPIIGSMFAAKGIRGKILNRVLHKQHSRVYNFDSSTEYGSFEPCSREAASLFLKLAHYGAGGRVFTYVLTLDGMMRFTETGKEFGIDMLSKHTMHSDVQIYIACSGEFIIRRKRRLQRDPSSTTQPTQTTAETVTQLSSVPSNEEPAPEPADYQLVIDNDSGTYRPDKSILPLLRDFLAEQFPGLDVVTMHWEEEKLQKMKEEKRNLKKTSGRMFNMVQNRSQSSISSAESELGRRDATWETGTKSRREAAFSVVEDPSKFKEAYATLMPKAMTGKTGDSSKT